MTKKVFLMLILVMAGIAGANAQVRIGGSEKPNQSAVLDLNPDDSTLLGNASLGLALPRVNLRNSADFFPLASHVKGMSVYNMATAGDVTPGVYVNDGLKWLRQLDSDMPLTSVVEKDSIVGNEVLNATAGGGLIRSGSGTAESPYTLGIAGGGVSMEKLSFDVVNEIMWNRYTGITPPERPNSILMSDNGGQWRQQHIPNNPKEIEISYNWVYNWVQYHVGSGWVDLGYSSERFSPGLYLITVRLPNDGSMEFHEVADYIALEAGSIFYTIARKRALIQNTVEVEESCLIFIPEYDARLRLYVHISEDRMSYSGECKLYAMPVLKLN